MVLQKVYERIHQKYEYRGCSIDIIYHYSPNAGIVDGWDWYVYEELTDWSDNGTDMIYTLGEAIRQAINAIDKHLE